MQAKAIFVYAYTNYHLSCIRIARARPLENVVNSACWRGTPVVPVESYIIRLEENLKSKLEIGATLHMLTAAIV